MIMKCSAIELVASAIQGFNADLLEMYLSLFNGHYAG